MRRTLRDGRPRRGRPSADDRSARAQTTVDFAVGAGLFLVVVAFVVAFVPGMFVAYDGSAAPSAADRGASTLAGDYLGSPEAPGRADPYCTTELFSQLDDGGDPPLHENVSEFCRFDTNAATARDLLSLEYDVNVTFERRDGSVVEMTVEEDTAWLPPGHDVTGQREVRLDAGPSTDGRDVTVARRVVGLDAGDREASYRLVVRVLR